MYVCNYEFTNGQQLNKRKRRRSAVIDRAHSPQSVRNLVQNLVSIGVANGKDGMNAMTANATLKCMINLIVLRKTDRKLRKNMTRVWNGRKGNELLLIRRKSCSGQKSDITRLPLVTGP
jgi:hypothetical protein